MMWNIVVAALLVGATTVAVRGQPMFPGADRLWEIAAAEQVAVLGTSPGHLQGCINAEVHPARSFDLSALRRIGVTGAPAPVTLNAWVAAEVSPDVPLVSSSGGTDVVAGFLGSSPDAPGRRGQALGSRARRRRPGVRRGR